MAKPTYAVCLERLQATHQMPSAECLPILISKLLGLAIVVTSPASKLPQIFNLVKSKSAEGIVVSMFICEVIVFSISWAYMAGQGMAFVEYGEAVIMNFLTCIIVTLVLAYSPGGVTLMHVLMMSAYAILLVAMLSGFVPLFMLRIALTGSVIFNISGRVPQILQNWRKSSTGQLSLIMFILNLGGTGVRVLTVLVQVLQASSWDKDLLFVLFNNVLSAGLNGIIVLQILYYTYYLKTKRAVTKSD